MILAEHVKPIVEHIQAGTLEDADVPERHQSASLGIKVDLGDYENISFHCSLGCDFGQDVNPLYANGVLTALCAQHIDGMMEEVGLSETLDDFIRRAEARRK